ncbi:MAG: V-type ATP synthase subunit D [Spirochaetales bacterium]|nr:V-type ATP synthase subunit D [Spirochaetales bacterium]
MARIKFTKNELKKQKEALQRFSRYLPTLLLKKQQLQTEIRKLRAKHDELLGEYENIVAAVMKWVPVFGEDIDVQSLIDVTDITIEDGNIAGIDIPVFKGLTIGDVPYDFYTTPLWVDRALVQIRKLVTLRTEIDVLEKDLLLLADELRITSQRVNLFEKVKIPEAKDNIRVIKIYLGDQQVAAVVRGKIAKNKIRRNTE